MEKLSQYAPPEVVVVRLQSRECILDLSRFGDENAPGQNFGDDNIIDYGDDDF